MTNSKEIFLSLLLFVKLLVCANKVASENLKPNIIFMFADDLGWNDVSFHKSSEISTPHIDSLVDEGLVLESHYVQPQCTPTRAAFLTGRYPIRYGLHRTSISPTDTFGLSLDQILLPEELALAGYNTHLIGKWHLGYAAWEYTPTFRGFETFFGFYNGGEDYYKRNRTWNDMDGYDLRDNTTPILYTDEYSSDLFGERAVSIIKNKPSDKPFFLYLAFQAVHSPQQYDPDDELWSQYSTIQDQTRRIHAYTTTKMDIAIGKIITTLKEQNLWDNTLLIFSSDNGAVYSSGSNYPLRGSKSTLWEGGIRVPTVVSGGYLESSRRGKISSELIHVSDWYPTFLRLAHMTTYQQQLDGIDQWDMIQYGKSSKREFMLISIDPLDGPMVPGSIRWGKWKFLNDPRKILVNEKTKAGCYWTDTFFNNASQSTLFGLNKINSQNVLLKCNNLNRPSYSLDDSCPCGDDQCLFDIENDPCEYYDLSKQYPEITDYLHTILEGYNNSVVTPLSEFYLPDDQGANPIRHDSYWTPWLNVDLTLRETDAPPTENPYAISRFEKKSSSAGHSTTLKYIGYLIMFTIFSILIGIVYYYSTQYKKQTIHRIVNKHDYENEMTPLMANNVELM